MATRNRHSQTICIHHASRGSSASMLARDRRIRTLNGRHESRRRKVRIWHYAWVALSVAAIGGSPAESAPASEVVHRAALYGRVSLPDGQPAEGVVVSAKNDKLTTTTSVVSDGQGAFSFPAARLPS